MRLWMFGRKGASGFSVSSTAEQVTEGIDGTGLTATVTGASSGISTETARVLALRGVHVVMAVRNMAAGIKVKEAVVKENPSAKVRAMELDLSSMASETMNKTACESSKEGRIVNASSHRHKFSYPESIRFDKINERMGFSTQEDGLNVTANSVHRGAITTNLFRHHSFISGLVGLLGRYVIKNVQQGAATTCYVALHPNSTGMSGFYFADSNTAVGTQTVNPQLAHELWDFNLDLINRCFNT